MGWKAIRDHYRIEHIVQVRDGRVLIGSSYVPDLLVVEPTGEVAWGELGPSSNDPLSRYKREMEADRAKLRELLATPDTFTASIPVFTYDGASIIEKRCEAVGWPNCTHDGQIMYDNTFSPKKNATIRRAKENARAALQVMTERVATVEQDLARVRARRGEYESAIAALDVEYPGVESPL